MKTVSAKSGVQKGKKAFLTEQYKETADLIRAKAREIWEASGREEGRDLQNWLEAEERVRRAAGYERTAADEDSARGGRHRGPLRIGMRHRAAEPEDTPVYDRSLFMTWIISQSLP